MSDNDKKVEIDEIVIVCREADDGTVWYGISVPNTMGPREATEAALQAAVQIAVSMMKPGFRDDPEKTTTLIKTMLFDLTERFYQALKHNVREEIIAVPEGSNALSVDPIEFLKSRGISTDPDDHLRDGP